MAIATASPSSDPRISPLLDPSLFPALTAEQLERVAKHGTKRSVGQDEVLLEIGDCPRRIYVVTRGLIQNTLATACRHRWPR